MVSTQTEIEELIGRHLTFGHTIQIGNLRITASSPVKYGDPHNEEDIIYFMVEHDDDDDGYSDNTFLSVPRSVSKPQLMTHLSKNEITKNLDNMRVIFRVLIWLGENLTGKKATLIENV